MQPELIQEILNSKFPQMQAPAISEGVVPEKAHFNLKEVQMLIALQGKEVRLPEQGNILSFMLLEPLFSDPVYLKLVRQVFNNLAEHNVTDHEVDMAVDEFSQVHKQDMPVMQDGPQIQNEAANGLIGGDGVKDSELCLCPSNMLDFFDEMRGYTSVNPIDGHRQYIFPLILGALGAMAGPAVATALGAGTLGTLGTALATGVGGMLGSKLGGAKWKDAIKMGAMSGLGSAAFGALGGAAGAAGGAGAGAGVGAVPTATGAAASAAAAPAAAGAAGTAAAGMPSMFSSSMLAPTAVMGAMLYKANNEQGKMQKRYEQEKAERNANIQRSNAAFGEYMADMGKDGRHEPERDYLHGHNTETLDKFGASPLYGLKKQPYKVGGIVDSSGGIHGKGKGQQDNIDLTYKVGDYVMPADVTSGLGDGHSSAGYDELDKLKNYIYKTKNVKEAHEKLPLKARQSLKQGQPVAVSPGEYKYDNKITVAVGDGDLKHADKIFQEFYKLVRKDKTPHGNKIPKKAKSAIEYFKMAEKKIRG